MQNYTDLFVSTWTFSSVLQGFWHFFWWGCDSSHTKGQLGSWIKYIKKKTKKQKTTLILEWENHCSSHLLKKNLHS